MNENKCVLVFVEQEDGKIDDVSFELLSKGRELANTLNSEVWALLCGHPIAALTEPVIQQGAAG